MTVGCRLLTDRRGQAERSDALRRDINEGY